jgi:AmmeMemoRadiSam system protein B
MNHLERPQLRPYLLPVEDPRDPSHVYLIDQLGLLDGPARLSEDDFPALLLMDGSRDLRAIQAEVIQANGGGIVPLDQFEGLVSELDETGLLDGPTFRRVADHPERDPRCIGCYEGEADALRRQLRRLFTAPGGSGLPGKPRPNGALRAALVPHIDYPRGGLTYTWGFKEIFEKSPASLFVIIGTSHYGAHPLTLHRAESRSPRFAVTSKHFKTPLGLVQTDHDYIARLERHYGEGLFDDELICHLPEHSIELEVVFLQYLYENVRPVRIVPLVVSTFADCVYSGSEPSLREDIRRMVEALRGAEAEMKEPICYIISGDLAHIGPKFDRADPPLTESVLEHSRQQDEAILMQAEAADPSGFFKVIADEGDRRNICGLPPTYTVLEALKPRSGKVLNYGRYVHPRGHESVSFASVAFYR